MAIRVLDAETASRIAAGEVVERPASAVKELFENALDAGATSITVEIKNGGIDYLRVTDNGCGIASGEVRMAFQNHATSKLQSADQLTDIRTMGFRGEALPSIAAVAKVECSTRRQDAPSGMRIRLEGGAVTSLEEVGCPEGTTVIVRDMFFNTPVRRTFLKKPSYEAGVVTDTVEKLLFGNPQVAVRLINNGKTVFHSFGDGNLRHAALAVYGRETSAAMMEVHEVSGALDVAGLIGVGDCGRPTRAAQSIFINKRVVRCPLVQQALENACKGRVTIGMHPMCVLHLTLPTTSVDVNVHPNKLEVRFRDEAGIRSTLDALFAQMFAGERMLDLEALSKDPEQTSVSVTLRDEEKAEKNKQTEVSKTPNRNSVGLEEAEQMRMADTFKEPPARAMQEPKSDLLNHFYDDDSPKPSQHPSQGKPAPEKQARPLASVLPAQRPRGDDSDAGAPSAAVPAQSEAREEAPFRIIGVAFKTYVLVETENALLIIDQHAAHERILYEKYVRLLDAGQASQQLLTPVILDVSSRELAQIEDQRKLLEEAGFSVEPFGEKSVAIRAVPFILGQADMRMLFMEMLDKLDQLRYATREKQRLELIQTSCKHAVKGGDSLTRGEIAALVEEMLHTGAPSTCPHGRPVVRSMTVTELERMFRRLQ